MEIFMDKQDTLIVAKTDFERLYSLIGNANSEVKELLDEELSRASVVSDDELPEDVVSMNSTVRFQDLDTMGETVVTLVYPHEAKIEENKVSILAPVGSALIGLRVGQDIQWPLPNGKKKRLKVISVLHQPE